MEHHFVLYIYIYINPEGEGSSCKIDNLSLDLKWAWQAHSFQQKFNYNRKIDIFLKGLNRISTIFKNSLDGQS